MRLMPLVPARRDSLKGARPIPLGLTAPMPETTTRIFFISVIIMFVKKKVEENLIRFQKGKNIKNCLSILFFSVIISFALKNNEACVIRECSLTSVSFFRRKFRKRNYLTFLFLGKDLLEASEMSFSP
jgi:hypothetical protein